MIFLTLQTKKSRKSVGIHLKYRQKLYIHCIRSSGLFLTAWDSNFRLCDTLFTSFFFVFVPSLPKQHFLDLSMNPLNRICSSSNLVRLLIIGNEKKKINGKCLTLVIMMKHRHFCADVLSLGNHEDAGLLKDTLCSSRK